MIMMVCVCLKGCFAGKHVLVPHKNAKKIMKQQCNILSLPSQQGGNKVGAVRIKYSQAPFIHPKILGKIISPCC
jgi:hypothetical protein